MCVLVMGRGGPPARGGLLGNWVCDLWPRWPLAWACWERYPGMLPLNCGGDAGKWGSHAVLLPQPLAEQAHRRVGASTLLGSLGCKARAGRGTLRRGL